MNPTGTPIPHDIPLPLPAPEPLLVFLLIVSFLAHILFVNLMLGGVLLTFVFELMGLKRPAYDRLALEIAKTVPVNKSMAVVLGVAPLLLLNVLYTVYFYTANALTGVAWILVIPLVSIAFLLIYLHKYAWSVLQEKKGLHLFIIGLAMAILLFIPLVFLANVNLMLFPDRWLQVKGFFSALMLPNVWPRYFHFLGASVAVTSLFLVGYLKRSAYDFSERLPGLSRPDLLKRLYTVALAVTGAQFLVGPLVFFTLPSHGFSWPMVVTIFCGVACALPAMYWLWREIEGQPERVGRYFSRIAIALSLTVVLMAWGRHSYRTEALASHQMAMKEKTERYLALSEEARILSAEEQAVAQAEGTSIDGGLAFQRACAACHHDTQRRVGPPLSEIREAYPSDPDGIVSWAKAPGRKRDDYPAMPPMMLPAEELKAIADFILNPSQQGGAP